MSWPLKARRPVLNLGPFYGGLFFASCVLEVYECQSPGDSSELPGYLDTSLQAGNTTARDRDDLRVDRGCIARPSVSGGRSTRVQPRETMAAVCKSTTRTGTLFPSPLDDGTVTPHEHKARRKHAMYSTHPTPRIDTSLRPTRHCS